MGVGSESASSSSFGWDSSDCPPDSPFWGDFDASNDIGGAYVTPTDDALIF